MKKSLSTKAETLPSIWLQIHPTLGVSMMDYLYAKLDVIYPGRWNANFKNEVAVQIWRETWAQAFDKKNISSQQVRSGIDHCLELYKRFPPSLPEFLDACLIVTPAAHRNFPPMLTHKATKEEREAGLKKVREIAATLLSKVRV